jgi:hypothetical protein
MNRIIGLILFCLAPALVLSAFGKEPPSTKKDEQDKLLRKNEKKASANRQAPKLLDREEEKSKEKQSPKSGAAGKEKKEAEKQEKLPELPDLELPGEPQENPMEIAARISRNLAESEERLEKKDAGLDTQKIQKNIVDDLEKLIKQQQESGGGGGAQARTKMSKRSKGSSSTKGGGAGGQPKSDSQPKGGAQANASKQNAQKQQSQKNMGSQTQNQQDKLAKAGQKQKDQKSSQGGANNKSKEEKSKNTVADLFPGIWGHLPATRRMEMDAYSRERFMRRYEDILRQYYRTIAEQNRRKEGE